MSSIQINKINNDSLFGFTKATTRPTAKDSPHRIWALVHSAGHLSEPVRAACARMTRYLSRWVAAGVGNYAQPGSKLVLDGDPERIRTADLLRDREAC